MKQFRYFVVDFARQLPGQSGRHAHHHVVLSGVRSDRQAKHQLVRTENVRYISLRSIAPNEVYSRFRSELSAGERWNVVASDRRINRETGELNTMELRLPDFVGRLTAPINGN